MHYIGFCPVCEEGTLGIRVCGTGEHCVVLCDECDAVWCSPDLKRKPLFPDQPQLPCPECQASLCEPPSHWADQHEVKAAGWADAVQGVAEVEDSTAKTDSAKPSRKKTVQLKAERKPKRKPK